MPLFDYKCPVQECGAELEILVKSPSDLIWCDLCYRRCGQEVLLEKQFSKTAPPQFKGTGFYATDYSRKKPK